MGTGLDPVTFPGMGPLRGKYVSETDKKYRFSHNKAISNIVFCISASYLLEIFMSIR